MSNPADRRKRILFVDDEKAFLEMIQHVVAHRSNDTWEVFVADTAGQALSILQSQPMDLVVIDIQMPVVDGLQFLSLLHRKYPNLQKVVLTGFATEDYRAASLSGGAELFLEKPRTAEGMETILVTLRELARWQPEEGFRGVLRRVGLQDVIQLECLSRHSLVLAVSAGGVHGEIFIKDGAIVHAQLGDQTGEAALYRLLSLPSGEFSFKTFGDPPANTIEGSWEFLLMEAARVRDEAGQAASRARPESPTVSRETAHLPSAITPSLPTPSAIPLSAPGRAGLSASTPAPGGSRGVELPAGTTAGKELTAGPKEAAPRIEEVMLCSAQGEVLYEWRCPSTNERINLLEFISQRARQLAQGLSLGAFDRVESWALKGRLVIQIRDQYGVLVRSNRSYDSLGQEEAS
jgi:CheY-like chemotaxis protein